MLREYPRVSLPAIPPGKFTSGYLLTRIGGVEDFTPEQQLLMWIRDEICGGNATELARRIDRAPNYVHRALYPVGKPGRKGIGLEIMQACTKAFELPAGFWEGAVPPPIPKDEQSAPSPAPKQLSAEARRMAAQFDALSEPEKQKIRAVWAALMQPASGDELGKSSGSPSGATQQKAA